MVEIKKEKANKKILNRIMEIDKTFYNDFDYQNNKNWYYERYLGKDFVLLYVDKKIVGYYCYFAVSKKLFDDIQKGKYADDYDFPLSEIYIKNSPYNYVPSILVLQQYRQYSIPLIVDLSKTIQRLDNVVALAVSKVGRKMCSKYMTECGKIKEYTIYVKQKSTGQTSGSLLQKNALCFSCLHLEKSLSASKDDS